MDSSLQSDIMLGIAFTAHLINIISLYTLFQAFRALNFWLPMLLGFILLRRVKILKPKPGAQKRDVIAVFHFGKISRQKE
jgi:hypothetical protein